PWPSRVARRNFRIWGSSSMTTTTGSGIRGHRGRRLAGEWKREEKRHAALGQILRPDVPAVRLDDAQRDRETEAGATTAGAPAIELLEHLVFLAARKTRPVVGNFHRDGFAGRRGQDADGTRARRVLDRIVEEVDQHLLDEDVVDRHQ